LLCVRRLCEIGRQLGRYHQAHCIHRSQGALGLFDLLGCLPAGQEVSWTEKAKKQKTLPKLLSESDLKAFFKTVETAATWNTRVLGAFALVDKDFRSAQVNRDPDVGQLAHADRTYQHLGLGSVEASYQDAVRSVVI
jgi:hypothetical protein